MRTTKVVIVLLLAVLSFYLLGLVVRSWAVVQDGGVLGWLLALGMVVLVVIAVGAVVAELRFGVATERLGRLLDSEGALPEGVPRSGDGRVDRAGADEAFGRYRT